MGVAFLDVLGVDWLEFAADFVTVCFFVALGMAPLSVFFPIFVSFSKFAATNSSFGSWEVRFVYTSPFAGDLVFF